MTLRLDWTGSVGQSVNVAGRGWKKVADLVVAARLKLGYDTRPAFAAASGISERTLGTLERGNPVSPRTLRVVETKLGMTPGYLDDVRIQADASAPRRRLISVPALNGAADDVDTPEAADASVVADEDAAEPIADVAKQAITGPDGIPYRDLRDNVVTPARLMDALDFTLATKGVGPWMELMADFVDRYGSSGDDD